MKWAEAGPGEDRARRLLRLEAFLKDILKTYVGQAPHATALQDRLRAGHPPTDLVESMRHLVRRHFKDDADRQSVRFGRSFILQAPIRALAALYAAGLACEEINRGDLWTVRQSGRPEAESAWAGAFMSSTYLLMRLVGATQRQADQCRRQSKA